MNHYDHYFALVLVPQKLKFSYIQILQMSFSPYFDTVQAKYRQYLEKIKLTDEAKTKTFELINELALIQLIYFSINQLSRKSIDEKLSEVEKTIESKLKGQGWMAYFSRTNEVITLEDVWKIIFTLQNHPKHHLIKGIQTLKENKHQPHQNHAETPATQ